MITIFFSFFLILTVITIIGIESANLRTNQNINSLQQGYNLPRLEYYNFLNAISKINLVNPSNQTNSIFNSSIQNIYNNLLQNFNLSNSIVSANDIILSNFSKFGLMLINTQSVATPSPFQQMISITNGDPFWTYIARNSNFGQNIEFTYSNGSVIPSWLESYTTNNATWWIKISGLSANANITIYIKIYSSSTNLFNNKTTGEAPQLSSTYAQYDDGANVFNFYSDFKGTSLNTNKWTVASLTYSVNNGLSVPANTGSCDQNGIASQTSFPSSVVDFYGSFTGSEPNIACDYTGIGFGVANTTAHKNQISIGTGNNFFGLYGTDLNSVSMPYSSGVAQEYSVAGTSSEAYGYINYANGVSSSISANLFNMPILITGQESDGVSMNINWILDRAYPPNGIMPSVVSSTNKITIFTESGLLSGLAWSVEYGSVTNSSAAPKNVTFYILTNGKTIPSYSYSIPTISTSIANPDCTTTYAPSPSSGSAKAGSTVSITFSASTSCTTAFSESGLPNGYTWQATYDSVTEINSSPNSIYYLKQLVGDASYPYSIKTLVTSSLGCTTTYTPSPSSGSVSLGYTVSITFSASTICLG